MEWIKELLSNPDQATALGYGAALTAASAYAIYKNDFGAEGRTTAELEDYLDDMDSETTGPLKMWKAHEYRKELQEREKVTEELDTDLYTENNYAEDEGLVYADD
jgi:hypothetical protein